MWDIITGCIIFIYLILFTIMVSYVMVNEDYFLPTPSDFSTSHLWSRIVSIFFCYIIGIHFVWEEIYMDINPYRILLIHNVQDTYTSTIYFFDLGDLIVIVLSWLGVTLGLCAAVHLTSFPHRSALRAKIWVFVEDIPQTNPEEERPCMKTGYIFIQM